GWVAGVGGTILATDNGGKNWAPQAMSLNAYGKALRAYFRDDRTWGWRKVTKEKPAHLVYRSKGETAWQEDDTVPARYPAPWFFVGLFVAAGFLTRAVRPDPPPVVGTRSVSDEYASDRPLEPGDPDPLQFGEVSAGLSRFIRNENTEPPLTIAVTGPWGTGKSSLMNLLCADLSQQGFRPVWFNAWHHQKEEHLLAALLETVRASAVPPWWKPAGWIFRFNLFFIRLKRRPHMAIILLALLLFPLGVFIAVPEAQWGAVADAVTSLFGGSEKDAKKNTTTAGILGGSSIASFLAFLVALLANARNRLGSLGMKPASLLSSLSGRSSARDLKAQLSFRHSFAAEFADVTRALKPISIVIVIDDIDRCRPDNVLEVLEAVNFLVTSGDCYVILGMDYKWTEKCIGEAYKEIADHPTEDELAMMQGGANAYLQSDAAKLSRRNDFARRYLQKLVNIEVPVPRVATEDASKIAQTQRTPAESESDKSLGSSKQVRRFAMLGMWVAIWLVLAGGIFGIGHLTGISIADSVSLSQVDKTAKGGAGGPGGRGRSDVRRDIQPQYAGAGRLYATVSGTAFDWLIWVPMGLLVIIFTLVGIEQWRRKGSAIIRDSPEFDHALQIWTPLVFSRDGTPRAIKRYLNRVRYFAMRQKSATETGSEAKLVALAALHHFDASLLEDGSVARSTSVEGFLSDLAGGNAGADAAIDFKRNTLHRDTGSKLAWPPSDEEIQQFKMWAAGITVR
ncbi:MAG: hypothetical protein HOK82_16775, partial [Rhodospirillaceae bacterium]|nr:hypothetical protein [Rhodospirillaceae bacterium]